MVSYGSGAGSDAFDLSVTDKIDDIRNRAPGVQQYIARRKEIDYATHTLSWQDQNVLDSEQ